MIDDLNNIINFDNETGLTASSRGEILSDLISLTRIAYGQDYVIEQGNEWYSFLDLLAGSLADMGGSVQDLYNSLSFVNASGTNLDNVVSFVGITRKPRQNSTVIIKATVTTQNSVTLPYTLPAGGVILQDYNGGKWTNRDILVIDEYKPDGVTANNIGTATFVATDQNTDPTNIVLQPYNDGHADIPLEVIAGSVPSDIEFMNETASVLGNPEETDAQLRARYKENLYSSSVGTVEGLIAAIKNNTNATYVHIIENDGAETVNNMPPHSIWVIVDGHSEWDGTGDYSMYPDDISIANTIFNYKSLGCATTYANDTYTPYNAEEETGGTGAIKVQITLDSTVYEIQFSRANNIPCYVSVDLSANIPEGAQRSSIEYAIKENIINYITSLGISNDVLQSGLSSCVYNVIEQNDYVDYVFDLNSITAGRTSNPTDKRISMAENEYPSITEENIVITWS